jgi:hypothetical protein
VSLSSLSRTAGALGLLLLACEIAQSPPRTPEVRENADACEGLAYVFFLVADKRDHGAGREEQIAAAQESVANPFTRDPRQASRDLLHVIDLVYRHPGADAAEIEAQVRAHCEVDARGRAVLRTLWPAPEPAAQGGGGPG